MPAATMSSDSRPTRSARSEVIGWSSTEIERVLPWLKKDPSPTSRRLHSSDQNPTANHLPLPQYGSETNSMEKVNLTFESRNFANTVFDAAEKVLEKRISSGAHSPRIRAASNTYEPKTFMIFCVYLPRTMKLAFG